MAGIFPLFFYKVYYNTLAFRRKIDDPSPLLRVLLLIFSVRRFLEEAPKLSKNPMIVLPTFSERGIWKSWKTCWLYPRELASSVPSDLLGGSPVLYKDCMIVWFLVCRSYFFGLLLVPQFPVMIGTPKFLEGLLRSVPGNLLPAFFFTRLMMGKVLTVCLPYLRQVSIVPKFQNFLGSSPKFLEGLLCDCEWNPGKSSPCLLFYSSRDKEGFDGLRTFYHTWF